VSGDTVVGHLSHRHGRDVRVVLTGRYGLRRTARRRLPATPEQLEGTADAVLEKLQHLVRPGLLEELLDLVLADRNLQSSFDALHAEREEHDQQWYCDYRPCSHDGATV
jgi:hypothetical protein